MKEILLTLAIATGIYTVYVIIWTAVILWVIWGIPEDKNESQGRKKEK